MVIKGAPLAAVHGQPDVALTVTVPDPPLAPKDWLVGDIEYEQAGVLEAMRFTMPPKPTT
jgi:hypothetical protein